MVEDQNKALKELLRVSKERLNLSVLTDKTMTGKLYIWANLFKPLINKINNFELLYSITGVLAFLVLSLFKTLHFFRFYTPLLRKNTIEALLNEKRALQRTQWGLYDPMIIPKIKKHPDSFYVQQAQQAGFSLNFHTTELISDYYFLKKGPSLNES